MLPNLDNKMEDFGLYISTHNAATLSEVQALEGFLDEAQIYYRISYERDGVSLWHVEFEDSGVSMVRSFIESFYAKQYMTGAIDKQFKLYIMGTNRLSQLMVQINTGLMLEYINMDNEIDSRVINDQIANLAQKMNGLDEFNQKNGLYTFRFIIETMLTDLGDQGIIRNPDRLKKAIFDQKPVH